MTKYLVHVRSEFDMEVSADSQEEATEQALEMIYADNRELFREIDMEAEELEND